jgi:hypothetical protein
LRALDAAPAWPWLGVVVLTLVLLAAGLQLVVAAQAMAPAQDAARSVSFAQAINTSGLWATVTARDEAPAFPTLVWLAHRAATAVSGDRPALWAHCVQGAAMASVLLAVPPLFLLLRRAFGTAAAGLGTALAVASPEVARLGANGLADGLFLALALWGVWLALERGHTWLGALGGGCALGLAFLARLEAVVLVPCLVWPVSRHGCGSTGPAWRSAALIVAGFACVLGGFTAATGKLTPKHGPEFLAHLVAPAQGASVDAPRRIKPPAISHKDATVTSREYGYRAAGVSLMQELPQATGWLAGVCALIGLWHARRSHSPAWDALVGWFTLVFLLGMWHFAAVAGYLSARHLLLPAVLVTGWAGVGLLNVSGWVEGWVRKLFASQARSTDQQSDAPRFPVPLVGLALALILSLTTLLRPLHASRQAHREAGDWLAATASRDEVVLDTRLLTSLYSGLATYGADGARQAAVDPQLRYVVVEAEELERDSPRGQALRRFVAGWQPAAQFPRLPESRAGRERVRKVYVFRRVSAP